MKEKYVPVSAFKDLLCDIYNVMNRLDYAMKHTGYGAPERTTLEWVAGKLKGTIEKAEFRVENADPYGEEETESACGDCTHDVREALGLSGGKEEEPEGLTAFSTKLLKDRLEELKQSASEYSVNDSLSETARACYQAKEDAYEVALSLIEINEEWQKQLAEGKKV